MRSIILCWICTILCAFPSLNEAIRPLLLSSRGLYAGYFVGGFCLYTILYSWLHAFAPQKRFWEKTLIAFISYGSIIFWVSDSDDWDFILPVTSCLAAIYAIVLLFAHREVRIHRPKWLPILHAIFILSIIYPISSLFYYGNYFLGFIWLFLWLFTGLYLFWGKLILIQPKKRHWVSAIFFWLFFSPMFFYLTKKWGIWKKSLRIILLLISPLFLSIYFTVIIMALPFIDRARNAFRFSNKEVIEKVTDISLPDFRVTRYHYGGLSSFQGDFEDGLTIKFKKVPSIVFYQTLDSLIAVQSECEEACWHKHNDIYSYHGMWSKESFPARKKWDGDMSFSITIRKGEREARITYGYW